MSNPDAVDNWLVQVSIKTRMGAMINIRALSPADLEQSLKEMAALTDLILEAEAAYMPSGIPVQQQAPQGPPQQQGFGQQPENAPMCAHGMPAKYVRGGISKTGRPYTAFWACAQPREQQCDFRQTA